MNQCIFQKRHFYLKKLVQCQHQNINLPLIFSFLVSITPNEECWWVQDFKAFFLLFQDTWQNALEGKKKPWTCIKPQKVFWHICHCANFNLLQSPLRKAYLFIMQFHICNSFPASIKSLWCGYNLAQYHNSPLFSQANLWRIFWRSDIFETENNVFVFFILFYIGHAKQPPSHSFRHATAGNW